MRIVIDSNRYTDMCLGEKYTVSVIRRIKQIFVPLIVIAEQRAGFANGSRRAHNEQTLTRFLNSERVETLLPDEQTTYFYADIYAELRKRGTPIPVHDIWIAALTIQHDLVLFDRDSHFDRIPRLARLGKDF